MYYYIFCFFLVLAAAIFSSDATLVGLSSSILQKALCKAQSVLHVLESLGYQTFIQQETQYSHGSERARTPAACPCSRRRRWLRGHAYTAERPPVFLSLLARSLPSSVVPPQLTSLPLLHGDVEEFLLVVVFTAKGRFLPTGPSHQFRNYKSLVFSRNLCVCFDPQLLLFCCSMETLKNFLLVVVFTAKGRFLAQPRDPVIAQASEDLWVLGHFGSKPSYYYG